MTDKLDTISLNKPVTPNLEKLNGYLKRVSDAGWYTNFGPLHQEFTERLEEYLGVKNLLLVSNGTFALQVAAKTLGVDNLVTTPFSFVATSSAMLWQNVKLNYCDIEPDSWNLSPAHSQTAIEADHSIDGILATHVYGNPCEVEKFDEISRDKGIKVIYDAAHAFGVSINGQSILNYGDASTLSFHATKVFHTIEGGAIIFKKKEDYQRAKSIINFGIGADGSIAEPGINAKLNEYQCAVGLTLLDDIEGIIKHRAKLFEFYCSRLKNISTLPKWYPKSTKNGAYMPVLFRGSDIKKVVKALKDNNIQYREYFSPSLDRAFPQVRSFGCANSNNLAYRVICLPLHYHLTESDVERVTDVIKRSIL